MQIPTDITANRHKGSATSIDANNLAEPSKAPMRADIVRYAQATGKFTMKDICRAFDKMPHQISGRLSELKLAGVIEETDERREKCAVLKLVA